MLEMESPPVCAACRARVERVGDRFTMCDVALLAAQSAASAVPGSCDAGAGESAGVSAPVTYIYILANRIVYAVPREWAQRVHPGGFSSIQNSNGRVCDVDFNFHSKQAQKKWAAFRKGVLDSCQHPQSPPPLEFCAVS